MCEFINYVPLQKRGAVGINLAILEQHAEPTLKRVAADALKADLPMDHFGGVFASSFLGHVNTQEEVAGFFTNLLNGRKQC